MSQLASSSLVPRVQPSPFTPLSSVLPPLDQTSHAILMSWDECLQRALVIRRAATMAIAYYGWRIKKSRRWSEFGYPDERSYRDARGVPQNTWNQCMRIGQVLESLSFDELCSISFRNAHALTTVNPDIWFDYPWIKESKSLTSAQFVSLVRDRNRLYLGNPDIDPRKLAQTRINAKLKTIRDENELKSLTEALEYSMSKVPADASMQLLASAKHAYKLINLALRTLRRRVNLSQHAKDEVRQLTKARSRLSEGIKVSLAAIEASRAAKASAKDNSQ